MRGARLWAGSLAYLVLGYGLMLTMGVIGLPLLVSTHATRAWQKLYIRLAFAMLRAFCGLRVEIRGEVPDGDVVIAAKHQSLLDVLALYRALPEPRFVMKRELLWAPVFGLYARRTGAVPIDRRGGKGTADRLVEAFSGVGGQIVIYPQGTRVAPGAKMPYKRGAAHLQAALGRPLVLAATNAGWFWPRRGVLRRPGVAVIEFLERPEPGLPVEAAQGLIEARIEAASDRLGREAMALVPVRGPVEGPRGSARGRLLDFGGEGAERCARRLGAGRERLGVGRAQDHRRAEPAPEEGVAADGKPGMRFGEATEGRREIALRHRDPEGMREHRRAAL